MKLDFSRGHVIMLRTLRLEFGKHVDAQPFRVRLPGIGALYDFGDD